MNGGDTRLNFVYIDDVADCSAMALEEGPAGIYNVASGEHTSLRQLADAVVALFGAGQVPLHVERATSESFPGFPALSIDKARQTWRFAPRPLARGLREYQTFLSKTACPDENSSV